MADPEFLWVWLDWTFADDHGSNKVPAMNPTEAGFVRLALIEVFTRRRPPAKNPPGWRASVPPMEAAERIQFYFARFDPEPYSTSRGAHTRQVPSAGVLEMGQKTVSAGGYPGARTRRFSSKELSTRVLSQLHAAGVVTKCRGRIAVGQDELDAWCAAQSLLWEDFKR